MNDDPSRHRGFVTASVMLATLMQAVDTTIANVALPHMQGNMGATLDQISWVLTSYVVASAIAIPMTGFLAARFGRKRIFMLSVAGFTVASMLCGAAQQIVRDADIQRPVWRTGHDVNGIGQRDPRQFVRPGQWIPALRPE